MAKIDETVFTVQIKAVNTILQLCYTLKDYVQSLIEQGNGNIDDITTINEHLEDIDNSIADLEQDVINLTNNKLSIINSSSYAIQIYGKQPDGSQKMYDASLDAMPNSVALRNSVGAMNVADPVWPSNAATKSYCDNGDLFENIKDNNGNKRFVEGSVYTVFNTGMGYTYTKWSLSGTHLMIVVAGQTTSDITGFGNYEELFRVYLPEWMLNKISIWYQNLVDTKTMIFKNASTGANAHTVTLQMLKEATYLKIQNLNALSLSADRQYRVQFDLLIDNSNS